VIAERIMRVLLARRFRGNINAAHYFEEEGEDPLGEIGEEQEEVEGAAIVVGQSSQGHVQLQLSQLQQTQTRPPRNKNHQKPQIPYDSIILTGEDNGETRSLQHKPISVVSPHLLPSPQRKRRLSKSAQEENDCKLRRRQSSVSSTKEEPSLLDRKPSARETGTVRNNIKKNSSFTPETIKVACATAGENTIPKVAAFSSSSSSKEVPLLTSRSNATITNNHNMVSGGPGRNQQHRRHGNSREREEEEHLLNWHYNNNNNHHPHHAVVRRRQAEDVGIDESEIIVQPTLATDFEGPLENDPASAHGDVSFASPERENENYDNGYSLSPGGCSSSAVRLLDSSFVIGRREESPFLPTPATTIRDPYELGRIAPAPRIAATLPPNRRDMSRIAPAAGSKRGTYPLQAKSKSWSNGNNNKKKASSTAEEVRFRQILKKERGLEIREQDGDGNCLFRAISLQVYGDPSMHGDVRKQCMDHMVSDWSEESDVILLHFEIDAIQES
jgi:hypothetical protein